jgi:hypothetical protein
MLPFSAEDEVGISRSPINNPFTPGYGDARVWVSRPEQTAVARGMVGRAVVGALQAPRIIEQERGYGKTSWLASVADQAPDWADRPIVVRAAAVAGEPFLPQFVARIVGAAQVAAPGAAFADGVVRALSRVRALRLSGVLEIEADPADRRDLPPSIAVERALTELGRAARDDGDRPIVLLLDEAQAIDRQSRRAVFAAMQAALTTADDVDGRVLPYAVLIAGLPGTRAAFKRHGVTFGERSRELPFGRLDDESVRATLLRFDEFNDLRVRFAPDAIGRLVEACGGHPHLFQLIGEGAWAASPDGRLVTTSDVDAGLRACEPERAAIIEARLADLTDPQLGWARAAATLDDDERTLTATCRVYRGDPTATAADCGSLADRLFAKGVVRRSHDGRRILFDLAGMRDHLA